MDHPRVGIPVSAESVILQGRAFTELLMTSTGVIRRGTGVYEEDPVTHADVEVTTVVYDGECKFKAASTQPGRSDIPGVVVVDQSATLSLPIGAAGAGAVRLNDVWECTSNPMDPSKVGQKARITGAHSQTYATAHRYPVEEVF